MICIGCASSISDVSLIEAPFYMVSSDVKPIFKAVHFFNCPQCGLIQKNIDEEWKITTHEIYKDYCMYHQGHGQEQKINSKSYFESRSRAIIREVRQLTNFSTTGEVLDFGCGDGIFLYEFFSNYPQWELYGADILKNVESSLCTIPNFKEYYSVATNLDIPKKFDCIFAVHTIEHLISPAKSLAKLGQLLKKEGKIVVILPFYKNNPFDLVIYDHCSHFNPATFDAMLATTDLEVESLNTEIFKKEIILILRKKTTSINKRKGLIVKEPFQHSIDSLNNFKQKCNMQLLSPRKIGIMGTSIGGCWLNINLVKEIDFYIDEDSNRIGNKFLGKEIISLSNIPDYSIILSPLPPYITDDIQTRVKNRTLEWISL